MHTCIHSKVPSESPSSSELPSLDHTNLLRAPGIRFFWALELFPAAAPSSQSCPGRSGQVRSGRNGGQSIAWCDLQDGEGVHGLHGGLGQVPERQRAPRCDGHEYGRVHRGPLRVADVVVRGGEELVDGGGQVAQCPPKQHNTTQHNTVMVVTRTRKAAEHCTHSFTVQSSDDVSNKFLWFLAGLGCGCTEVTRPKCADN